jgi:hypothetical protein
MTMPDNTRLNTAIRVQAVNKLMKHTFTKRLEDLIQFRSSIALSVYYERFNPEQRILIAQMPDDWKCEERGMYVHLDGENHYMPFNGALSISGGGDRQVAHLLPRLGHKSMALPHSFTPLKLSKSNELGKAIETANMNEASLNEEYATTLKKTEAMFRSFSTIGKLKETWPEVAPFLPETVPHLVVALPAIVPQELNRLLNLPV